MFDDTHTHARARRVKSKQKERKKKPICDEKLRLTQKHIDLLVVIKMNPLLFDKSLSMTYNFCAYIENHIRNAPKKNIIRKLGFSFSKPKKNYFITVCNEAFHSLYVIIK